MIQIWLGSERHSQDESLPEHDREQSRAAAQNQRAAIEQLADDARKKLTPFHWWLEFPEVFFEERPDPLQGGAVNGAALMEGVVGNPPFGGKSNIVNSSGADLPGLASRVFPGDPGVRGNCDLSAYFFRRAAQLLGQHGAFGLIATNTIAQGDSRAIGLLHLVSNEQWELFEATDSMLWPGAASVVVSLVHCAHGAIVGYTKRRLNNRDVSWINTRLTSTPERTNPEILAANVGLTYSGSILLGSGFILTPDERDALVKKSPRNERLIFPILEGKK